MKEMAPSYYPRFACIAGDCRHSCCVGWEIDIDDHRLADYQRVEGPLGQRLRESISTEGGAHFVLSEEERCPFLNGDGLCDLILELGEDHLCQICADHPRFRNFWSDRTELGLGLCCEAAAELMLSGDGPMELLVLSYDGGGETLDEEEAWLLDLRGQVMDVLQDRSRPLTDRVREMLDVCGAAFPEGSPAVWAQRYLELERLDPRWTELLESLAGAADWYAPADVPDSALEQLLVYFVYRHFPAALEDGDVSSKAAFAALSAAVLHVLSAATGEPFRELARMYSAEIEYSDENLWALFDELTV